MACPDSLGTHPRASQVIAVALKHWKLLAGIALALLVVAALYAYGERRYTAGNVAGKSEVQQAWDAAIAIGKDELLRREREARAMEQRHSADMARIGTEHQEELTNAKRDAKRLLDDLRLGNVKLQDRWRGCVAASGVLQAPGSTGQSDAAADDRSASASRIVFAAAQCDAQVSGLQSIINADRDTK